MADTKVSALTAVATPATTDEFPVNQGGTSKKMTLAQIVGFGTYGGPTFLVASNDAPAAVKAAADYVCDGTTDNVEIQAALDALPSTGGHIQLTGGRFYIASQVQITKHGVIFEGVGWGDPVGWTEDSYGTTLMAVSGVTNSILRVSTGAIGTTAPVAACQVKNLMIDGGGGTTTPIGTAVDGIQFSSFTGLLANIRVVFCSGRGVYVVGKTTATTWSTYDTRIDTVQSAYNTLEGFYLDNYAEDLQIFGVVAHHNKGDGIDDRGSSNQFFGCHAYDNGDGGGANGTTSYNLYVASSVARTKFTGCKFEHAEGQYGVYVAGWETIFTGCNFHNNGDKWGSPTTTAVTFQDTGDTVTQNDHRLLNGDAVQFSSITSTTGISINTTYYVVGRTTNTFQVSASVGGSALPLTTNGSGVLVRGDGGASRGHMYIAGGMTVVTGCEFGIKNNDFSIGSGIEVSASSASNQFVGNTFQVGNADTSGFWNGVALFRSGAVVDTGSKATYMANLGLVSNAGNVRAIEFVIDGGGATITTGVKGDVRSQITGTIERASLLADQSGSIVVDIWKDTYANYPPTVADTITASAKPTISATTKAEDTTLTGWTKSVTAGDTLRFNVDSVTTIQRVTVILYIRESV